MKCFNGESPKNWFYIMNISGMVQIFLQINNKKDFFVLKRKLIKGEFFFIFIYSKYCKGDLKKWKSSGPYLIN